MPSIKRKCRALGLSVAYVGRLRAGLNYLPVIPIDKI
jgi:hypothetical protein